MKHRKHSEEDTRIGRLDENTLGYYRRVSDKLKENSADEEEKALFLKNTFTHLCDEALVVSRNQTVSGIVESLLAVASPEQLCSFCSALAVDWETAFSDRFASHVTQSLIKHVTPILYRTASEDEMLKKLNDDFILLCSQLLGNLGLFMQHTYASHILRAIFQTLAGITIPEGVLRSRGTKKHSTKSSASITENKSTPESFKRCLKEFAHKIIGMPRLEDYARNPLSNPVLQALLLACKYACEDDFEDLLDKMIESTKMFPSSISDDSDGNPSIPRGCLLGDATGSFLVQHVIALANPDQYERLLRTNFEMYIPAMAVHPCGNFIVQELILNVQDKRQFKCLQGKLIKIIEDILANGNYGLIVCLAQKCLLFKKYQSKLVVSIMEACHCNEPAIRQSRCFPLFASLSTYEFMFSKSDSSAQENISESEQVNLHGSLILQSIMQYSSNAHVVCSLLAQPTKYLIQTLNSPQGSHIYDAFFKSETIDLGTKSDMLGKLEDHLVEICCDKFGSRVLETAWSISEVEQRRKIISVLADHSNKLRGNRFGIFAWNKFDVQLFKENPQKWEQKQNNGKNQGEKSQESDENTPNQKSKKRKADKKSKKTKKRKLKESDDDE